MGSKTVDDVSFRPEFMTFNHRGRVQLTVSVSAPVSLCLCLFCLCLCPDCPVGSLDVCVRVAMLAAPVGNVHG